MISRFYRKQSGIAWIGNCVDYGQSPLDDLSMRWIRNVILLGLAILLLPASVHLSIGGNGMNVSESCVECGFGSPSGSTSSNNCVCSQTELGLLSRSAVQRNVILHEVLKLALHTDSIQPELISVCLPNTKSPQEFLVGWQFAQRTARMPRDPSLAS